MTLTRRTSSRMPRVALVLTLAVTPAAIALLAAAPALAQTQAAAGNSGKDGIMPGGIAFGDPQVDDATLEKRREVERAYKDATKKIPAQAAAVNDPWANMRGSDEQKPAAKPMPRTAKKKPTQ